MVSERTATPTGSPGLIKLLSKGLNRVTGRGRSSAQSNGKDASPSPTQQSKVTGKAASDNEGIPNQQVQLEVNGESPDATEPVNHDMLHQSTLQSLDAVEEDVSGQPGQSSASPQHLSIVPFPDAEYALPQAHSPFNSEAWPHQALQVAEERPMPFKRSSDILDLIDSQLSGRAKRQRLELPDPTGNSSLALLGPQTGASVVAAAQSPAVLPANRSVISWQSPVGASPFRRHVAPLPSRLSRPSSAPFTAGRAPVNSPAIPSSRATRSKNKAAASLQQHSVATAAKSPVQAFTKPSSTVKQHAFRLGQTDAQLPGSSSLMLPAPEPAGQTAIFTDAQEPAMAANALESPAAFTPMKALQSRLAKSGADERTAEGTPLGPSSLLAAGLHVNTAAPPSTSISTRARRYQGRAVHSAQKRKAADLEAPDAEPEEPAESQRHRKQARRGAEDSSNTRTQPLATALPPTAVLGFTPQALTNADKASSTALQTDADQANVEHAAPDKSQQADNRQGSLRDIQPKAKDYGAPWVAAAAAPASQDAQHQVIPPTGAEGPGTTPPATSKLFGSLPLHSSPAAQLSPFLGGASFAPSPSTAPPKKPFSLFPDLSSSTPSAFPGFGASSSSAAASQPTAAAFQPQAAASQPKAIASEPNAAAPAFNALPAASNATTAASTTPKPAAEPSFPSLPFSPFSVQPSAQVQHLGFNFAAPAAGTQHPEPEVSQPQAQEAAVSFVKEKVEDAADRSNREASVSSDASGDTAMGEHLYPFSSQRSAQDRLEGLVSASHLAANDTEGMYTFGQTRRSLADQNKPELPEDHQQDLPVTPLQNGVPTMAEADRLQAMAKAVPLPSPLASSPDPSPRPSTSHRDPGPDDREPSAEPSSGAQSPGDRDSSPDGDAASNDASAGTAVQDGNSAEASVDDEDDAGDAETIHVATDTEDPDAATIVLSSSSSGSLAEASGTESGSSSSDEDVSSVGTTDDEAAAAEAPTPELAGASEAIPAAGWGPDFLKRNQAAARSAADAAADVEKAESAAADGMKTEDAPHPGIHAFQTPVPAARPQTAFQAAAALPLPDDDLPAPSLQSASLASQPATATELQSVNMFEALAEPEHVAEPEPSAQAAPTDNAGAVKPRRYVRRKQKP